MCAVFLVVRLVLRRQGLDAIAFVVGNPFLRGCFDQGSNLPAEPADGFSELLAAQMWPATAQGGADSARFKGHAGQLEIIPAPLVMNSSSAPVLEGANPVVRILSGNFDLEVELQPGNFHRGGQRCQHAFCLAVLAL